MTWYGHSWVIVRYIQNMWGKGRIRNHNICTSSHTCIKQSCNEGDFASSEKDPRMEEVYICECIYVLMGEASA